VYAVRLAGLRWTKDLAVEWLAALGLPALQVTRSADDRYRVLCWPLRVAHGPVETVIVSRSVVLEVAQPR
jgi:hypothetical protein